MDLNEQEEDRSATPDDAEKWQALRTFLKELLLTGEIPMEPSEMRPKAVYLQYQDKDVFHVVDYDDKKSKEKYGRLLLSLLRST